MISRKISLIDSHEFVIRLDSGMSDVAVNFCQVCSILSLRACWPVVCPDYMRFSIFRTLKKVYLFFTFLLIVFFFALSFLNERSKNRITFHYWFYPYLWNVLVSSWFISNCSLIFSSAEEKLEKFLICH